MQFFKSLVCLFFCIISFQSHAQKDSLNNFLEEQAKLASQEICDCTNNILKDTHPILKDYLLDIPLNGNEKAYQNFTKKLKNLTDLEKSKIYADNQKFLHIKENETYQFCLSKLQMKYQDLYQEPSFVDMLFNFFYKNKNCEFTVILLNLH